MKRVGIDMAMLQSEVLLQGSAQGPLLSLTADISFWGGVDPLTGKIIDRRHPQFGECLAGKILVMRRSIGSSSGSSVLLELFRRNCAPLGIIMAETDLVVALGAVVAKEMALGEIPVLCLEENLFSELPEMARIHLSGEIESISTQEDE